MIPPFEPNGTWHTSVQKLIAIFRDTLLTLIPSLERAHIAWRSPDAYEAWDAIAETLFRTMVIDAITWGLPPDGPDQIIAPVYETSYFSYAGMSYIEVVSPSIQGLRSPGSIYLFHGFSTVDAPFDTVECVSVDADGDAMSGTFVELPYEQADFRFRYRRADGSASIHEELAVKL